jgi:hypothetical protein
MRRTILTLALGLGLAATAVSHPEPIVPAVTTRHYCSTLMLHAEGILHARRKGLNLDEWAARIAGSRYPLPSLVAQQLVTEMRATPMTQAQAWDKYGAPCIKRIRYASTPQRYLVLELPRD